MRCVINLMNSGAGIPDGGLFTADQFRHSGSDSTVTGEVLKGLLPSRWVIEAKAPHEELEAIAASERVRRYYEHYRVVLVTNFRAPSRFAFINGKFGGAAGVRLFAAAIKAEVWLPFPEVVFPPHMMNSSHNFSETES